MAQLHKRFSDEQIRVLFQGYYQGQFSRVDLQEMLDIGKTRFFALLSEYRRDPETFTIVYQRAASTKLSAEVEASMPRSTYYDVVKKNPEAVTEYQEVVDANARHQLGMILFHKTETLQKFIEDGLSKGIPPRERLALYKALNELEGV